MAARLKSGELERLPLFPLPGTVLLPNTIVRLHIFEPRYRKMTKDLLESKGPMAIGKIIPGKYDETGRPIVRTIIGIGRIVQHLRLPDGRYYLTVEGLCRARIREELETTEPYRVIRATRMRELYPGRQESEVTDKMILLSFAKQLVQMESSLPPTLLELLAMLDRTSDVCDIMAAHFFESPEELQTILETPRVDKRVETLIAGVSNRLDKVIGTDNEMYN